MMTVASCSKDDTSVADNSLRFVAGLVPQTMAPIESDDNGLVTNGDVSGIQLVQGEYGSTPKFNEVGAVTRVATLDGTGLLSYTGALTINTDGSTANFLAFYPAGTLTWGSGATPATVRYAIDGTQDIIAAGRVSKTYSPSDNRVNLAFKHQLARLRFRCVCADDANGALYQGVTEAKIIVPKYVTMRIPDNGIITTTIDKPEDDTTPIEYTTLDFGTCEMSIKGEYAAKNLMIHPDVDGMGMIKDMVIYIKFAGFPDDAARAYSINNVKLVAGKTTTITATVSGATSLTITASIEPWNTVDTNNDFTVE